MPAAQAYNGVKPLSLSVEGVSPFVLEQCEQMFFRQSFLYDFLTCGKMAYFGWIEESSTEDLGFFSAHLGTAGHEVIYNMHKERNFNLDFAQLMDRFDKAFTTALANDDVAPKIGVKYASIQEELAAKMPEYLNLLDGYQRHPINQRFHSTIHEQAFVLQVDSKRPGHAPYLFTGTIDQGGVYDDGTFVLRDIKFRDNQFKPGTAKLALDIQITIYAAAMLAGYPACRVCSPKYITDPITLERTLHYDGPCPACQALIGTKAWPRQCPERCEIVWLKDFERRTEDQHDQFVINKDAPKIPNPAGGKGKIFPRNKLNPLWQTGYKKGDYKGQCFLTTYRQPSQLKVLMEDIILICDAIRRGEFYRRPGEHCSFWCKFRDACTSGIKAKLDDEKLREARAFTSADPFE